MTPGQCTLLPLNGRPPLINGPPTFGPCLRPPSVAGGPFYVPYGISGGTGRIAPHLGASGLWTGMPIKMQHAALHPLIHSLPRSSRYWPHFGRSTSPLVADLSLSLDSPHRPLCTLKASFRSGLNDSVSSAYWEPTQTGG